MPTLFLQLAVISVALLNPSGLEIPLEVGCAVARPLHLVGQILPPEPQKPEADNSNIAADSPQQPAMNPKFPAEDLLDVFGLDAQIDYTDPDIHRRPEYFEPAIESDWLIEQILAL